MGDLVGGQRKIAAIFAVAAIATTVLGVVIRPSDPDSPELAGDAVLATAVIGVAGLLTALRWWSTAGEHPVGIDRLRVGFIMRIALAETGLILGLFGNVLTGSATPVLVGGGLFLVALLILGLGLKRVEIQVPGF